MTIENFLGVIAFLFTLPYRALPESITKKNTMRTSWTRIYAIPFQVFGEALCAGINSAQKGS